MSAYNMVPIRLNRTVALLLINIVFDAVIAALLLAYGIAGLTEVGNSGWCYWSGRYDCWNYSLRVRVVAGFVLAFAVLAG